MKRLQLTLGFAMVTAMALACSVNGQNGSATARKGAHGSQSLAPELPANNAKTATSADMQARTQAQAQAQAQAQVQTQAEAAARLMDYGQFLVSDLKTKQEELEEIKKRIPATEEELLKSPDLIDDLNRIESEFEKGLATFDAMGVAAGKEPLGLGKTPAAAAVGLALADGASPMGDIMNNPITKFLFNAGRLLSGVQAWLGKCLGPSDGETVAKQLGGGNIIFRLLAMISNIINTIVKFITSCLFGFSKAADSKLVLFDNITFYDSRAVAMAPTPAGVVRLDSYTVARRITPQDLANFGSDMQIKFIENARCATIDGGNQVKLAMVGKGELDSLTNKAIKRIEIGRFFNPFTDKNVQPTQITYKFKVGNLAKVLRNAQLNATNDFWIEAGMYNGTKDAVGKVAGCDNSLETFNASVELISNSRYIEDGQPFILPLTPEKGSVGIEPLTEGASDEPGKAKRTFAFELARPLQNAAIYLTVSAHGPGPGGEEYNRRWHNLTFDGQLIKRILPGEPSCEPYRYYNTMVDGVYLFPTFVTPRTWCPGAITPARRLDLGSLSAGKHSFVIDVENFNPGSLPDNKNNIFTALYLQGDQAN